MDQLPNELITMVLEYVSLRDALRFTSTCTQMYDLLPNEQKRIRCIRYKYISINKAITGSIVHFTKTLHIYSMSIRIMMNSIHIYTNKVRFGDHELKMKPCPVFVARGKRKQFHISTSGEVRIQDFQPPEKYFISLFDNSNEIKSIMKKRNIVI